MDPQAYQALLEALGLATQQAVRPAPGEMQPAGQPPVLVNLPNAPAPPPVTRQEIIAPPQGPIAPQLAEQLRGAFAAAMGTPQPPQGPVSSQMPRYNVQPSLQPPQMGPPAMPVLDPPLAPPPPSVHEREFDTSERDLRRSFPPKPGPAPVVGGFPGAGPAAPERPTPATPRSGGSGEDVPATFNELTRALGASALAKLGIPAETIAQAMLPAQPATPGEPSADGSPTRAKPTPPAAKPEVDDPSGSPAGRGGPAAPQSAMSRILQALGMPTSQATPLQSANAQWERGIGPEGLPRLPAWMPQPPVLGPDMQWPMARTPGGASATAAEGPGQPAWPTTQPSGVARPQGAGPMPQGSPVAAPVVVPPAAAAASAVAAPGGGMPNVQQPGRQYETQPGGGMGQLFREGPSPDFWRTLAIMGATLMKPIPPGGNWLGSVGNAIGSGVMYQQMQDASRQARADADKKHELEAARVGLTGRQVASGERRVAIEEAQLPGELAMQAARIRQIDAQIAVAGSTEERARLQTQRDMLEHGLRGKYAEEQIRSALAYQQAQTAATVASTPSKEQAAQLRLMAILKEYRDPLDGKLNVAEAGRALSIAGIPHTLPSPQIVDEGMARLKKFGKPGEPTYEAERQRLNAYLRQKGLTEAF